MLATATFAMFDPNSGDARRDATFSWARGAAANLDGNGVIAFYRVRSVAAARNGEWGNVYVVDRRGRSLRLVGRRTAWPAWSPDGLRLAVNANDDFEDVPGGPELVQVPVGGPSWAPDGQRLVGMTLEGSRISVFDLRTKMSRTIYEDDGAGSPTLSSPDWSPNGKQIAVDSSFGGNYGITFLDVASRRFVHHGQYGNNGQHPAWSPDGRRIAFDTYTDEQKIEKSSIYVAPLNGAQRKLVARNGHSPAWSPDGQLIAFVRMVSRTNSEIFVVNANGTGLKRLTHFAGPDSAPDWQPLPRRYAVRVVDLRSVENGVRVGAQCSCAE